MNEGLNPFKKGIQPFSCWKEVSWMEGAGTDISETSIPPIFPF